MISNQQLTEMFHFWLIKPEARASFEHPFYYEDTFGEVRDAKHRTLMKTSGAGIMDMWKVYDSFSRYQSIPILV